MSRGQVQVTDWERRDGRALDGVDPQLVADVGAVLGHTPAYADVMETGHRWGTTPTGTLLQILERAYPMPPPPRAGGPHTKGRREGNHDHGKPWGLVLRAGRSGAPVGRRLRPACLGSGQRRPPHNRGLSDRCRDVIDLPTDDTTCYDALVSSANWPAVLNAAVSIADKEGVKG